ncbi:hypothetical protein PRIPAC_83777, partial [Pristionchus pacificus]|uniref:Uncharacterized protein n=1 Tax=Pristionchus pacificus TaxID=54126 RepID=A0A2A6BSA1_PRIPA
SPSVVFDVTPSGANGTFVRFLGERPHIAIVANPSRQFLNSSKAVGLSSSKTRMSYRTTFFEMMRAVSVTNPYVDRNAIDMFISLFHLHRKEPAGVITTENLTDNEKTIVQSHMIICLRYLAISFSGFTKASRELISGMAVFRLEVIPQLLSLASEDAKEEFVVAIMPLLIENEQTLLPRISSCMEALNIKEGDGSHALHTHPWWHGNLKVESESEIMENYKLTD